MMRHLRRWTVAAVAGAAALAAGPFPSNATAAEAGHRSTVRGLASGPLREFEGQRARLAVDARAVHAARPHAATGTFTYDHLYVDGTPFVELSGRVDCLTTTGGVAVLTGRVTRAELPEGAEDTWTGLRVGFAIADRGRHDGFGWSWQTGDVVPDMPRCAATAPTQRTDRGDFTVGPGGRR